jgi:hypothetical protein
MFTAGTRISDALAVRPELRAILPAFHPAFSKLSHPILGKVLPRLVTVADAARIAGVEVDALLAVMNLPGPPPGPPPAPAARVSEPAPHWLAASPVRELDARPTLAAGGEPFAPIMTALRELDAGAVLTVLAPFEPAPLLRLMAGRGWFTHVGWDGDTCRASFWRPAAAGETDAAEPGERLTTGPDGRVLDVRGLEPPRPMELVLAAVDAEGGVPLTVVHEREPVLLFPRLAERGLAWTVSHVADHVEIRIARA